MKASDLLRWRPKFVTKLWPVPVWGPMWPFFAGALLVGYGVNSLQNTMMESDEWKKDPRNPKVKAGVH